MSTPKPKFVWPYGFDPKEDHLIQFTYGGTGYTATMVPGIYAVLGDDSQSDLLRWFKESLEEANASDNSIGVSVDASGFITITADKAPFAIDWANSDFPAETLGFKRNSKSEGATSYKGDWQHAQGWYPDEWVQLDQWDRIYGEIATDRALFGVRRTQYFGSSRFREINFEFIQKHKIFEDQTNYRFQSFENFYKWMQKGGCFYLFTDAENTNSNQGLYMFREEGFLERFPFDRQNIALERWTGSLVMERYEYGNENKIANPDFQATHATNDFRDWKEDVVTGSSSIEVDKNLKLDGRSHSVRFKQWGTESTNCNIYQDFSLEENSIYRLRFVAQMGGTALRFVLENKDIGSFWNPMKRKWDSTEWKVAVGEAKDFVTTCEHPNIYTLGTGTNYRLKIDYDLGLVSPPYQSWLFEVSLQKHDELTL